MVLFGAPSHGRCPSPVPRWVSAKMCTSSAFWLPSGCGIAPLPMNEPSLISASEAFTTPTIVALPVSVSVAAAPSRVFTDSVLPSTFSIVPRSLWVCATAGEIASAAKAAHASTHPAILLMAASHRRGEAAAADRDRGGFERAVVLFGGAGDEDLGAGLELVLAAGDVGHDHRVGRDDDLLFPLLVLERDLVAAHAFHHLCHGGVGHGAVGHQVPRPEAFTDAAQRLGEDVNLDRLLA